MRIAIVQMAKAPVAGLVKTRLVPPFSYHQACNLHKWLVSISFRQIQAAVEENATEQADIFTLSHYLCYSAEHEFFTKLCSTAKVNGLLQAQGDLGVRLKSVALALSKAHDAVILMGSDCPYLHTADIIRAARSLCEPDNRAILIPALDGGYTLFGVKAFDEALVKDIQWSTDTVFKDTCDRLRELGAQFIVFAALSDIDTWKDINHLAAEISHKTLVIDDQSQIEFGENFIVNLINSIN